MTDRRRLLLLVAFGAMVVLTLGDRVWTSYYDTPMTDARKKASRLEKQIEKARRDFKIARNQHLDLVELRQKSLAGDAESVRTLYQGWLTDLAERVELDSRRVDSNRPRPDTGHLVLPFTLRGTGSLEQLTALLFDFYQAPQLHQIRTLTITPIAGSRQLNLNLSIELVVIKGTEREDAFPTSTAEVLAADKLDDYRQIARRNIFSTSGGVEATEYTVLTAIVSVDGLPEAWFTNRLDDTVDKVHEGDSFRVGTLHCQVESISLRDLVLAADGQRWLLAIPDRLADATALPPEY